MGPLFVILASFTRISRGSDTYSEYVSIDRIQAISHSDTMTVAYLNAMGGRKSLCNELTRQIEIWCIDRSIWISTAHLPGVAKTRADRQSRLEQDNTEWTLDSAMFRQICDVFGTPTEDLFASRFNGQLESCVSWRPGPGAIAVDTMTLTWSEHCFCAFPPFSMIPRCLQKIMEGKAEGILIAPLWPTLTWLAQLMQMLMNCSLLLRRRKNL